MPVSVSDEIQHTAIQALSAAAVLMAPSWGATIQRGLAAWFCYSLGGHFELKRPHVDRATFAVAVGSAMTGLDTFFLVATIVTGLVALSKQQNKSKTLVVTPDKLSETTINIVGGVMAAKCLSFGSSAPLGLLGMLVCATPMLRDKQTKAELLTPRARRIFWRKQTAECATAAVLAFVGGQALHVAYAMGAFSAVSAILCQVVKPQGFDLMSLVSRATA